MHPEACPGLIVFSVRYAVKAFQTRLSYISTLPDFAFATVDADRKISGHIADYPHHLLKRHTPAEPERIAVGRQPGSVIYELVAETCFKLLDDIGKRCVAEHDFTLLPGRHIPDYGMGH